MPPENSVMISVGLVDDHSLVRHALAETIERFPGYSVLFEAGDGSECIGLLQEGKLPDVLLLDVSMPNMNGLETSDWINRNLPSLNVVALSMRTDEATVMAMLRNGIKGFLSKTAELDELQRALNEVREKGIWMNDLLYRCIVHNINRSGRETTEEQRNTLVSSLSEREKQFLRLLCTDRSYKEIAAEMCVSPRTVDGYRDTLFDKLRVASRVGLVLFAVRHDIAQL